MYLFQSIVKLGNLVVIWPFDTFGVVSEKLGQLRQGLHSVVVLEQSGVLFEKLAFAYPLHELA